MGQQAMALIYFDSNPSAKLLVPEMVAGDSRGARLAMMQDLARYCPANGLWPVHLTALYCRSSAAEVRHGPAGREP
jgi:hypothetical protein